MVTREHVLAVFDDPSRIETLLKQLPLRKPRTEFVEHDGRLIGVKLAWSLAHEDVMPGADFTTNEAKNWLRKLGFVNFVSTEEADLITTPKTAEGVIEIHKRVESMAWTRDPGLRAKALAEANYTCEACSLRPEEVYQGARDGCLDAHHLRPMSQLDGTQQSVSLGDIACLCANCHRMIHLAIVRTNRNVTVIEFRNTLKSQVFLDLSS